jgi:hypothetical protein
VVKLRLYRFWSGGHLLEALQAFLLKRMDRVAHGLGHTTQVASNFLGTLFSAGRQQNLTPAQGKGIRGAQASFSCCLLSWLQGSDIYGSFPSGDSFTQACDTGPEACPLLA